MNGSSLLSCISECQMLADLPPHRVAKNKSSSSFTKMLGSELPSILGFIKNLKKKMKFPLFLEVNTLKLVFASLCQLLNLMEIIKGIVLQFFFSIFKRNLLRLNVPTNERGC